MEQKIEEFKSGLTLRVFLLGLIILFISILFGTIEHLYTDKPATFSSFFLPFMYIGFLNELVRRINRKWALTKQELCLLFFPTIFLQGLPYIMKGIPDASDFWLFDYFLNSFAYAFNNPYMSEYWKKMTPDFMFPKDPSVATALYYGGALEWGPLIIPIIYWSAIVILFMILNTFIPFVLAGKQWTEVERLAYPLGEPHYYFINEVGTTEEKEKPRLFDTKRRETKVFWAAFLVGTLISIIPFIVEILPAVSPLTWFYGNYILPMTFIGSALPGSYALAAIDIPSLVLFLLLPTDILLTSIVGWIIFGIIYQYIAVQTGIFPYVDGMEYFYPWDGRLPAWSPPFPYGVMAGGMCFGIGAWCLWNLRGRLKQIASTFRGKDVVEEGLSLRTGAILGLASFIGIIILFTASGTPFPIALIFMIMWFVWYLQIARSSSEWIAYADSWVPNVALSYSIGGYLGYWLLQVPAEGNNYTWFVTNSLIVPTTMGRLYSFGAQNTPYFYKMAHYTRTILGDAFKMIVVCIVFGVIFYNIINPFILAHGGGISRVTTPPWNAWTKAGAFMQYEWLQHKNPNISFNELWIWTGVGFVLSIIIYLLRMKFAWFFINPVGLAQSMFSWAWAVPNALGALILKVIFIRILGPRKYLQYVSPLVSGFCLGFGASYLFAGIINFSMVAWPKFMSYYTP